MKKLLPWTCLLLLLRSSLATAQTASPLSSASDPSSADAAWQAVKHYGRPGHAPGLGASKPTPPQLKVAYLTQADELKVFQTRHAAHPSAREAKQKELIALALAALNGDTTQDSRRQSLLAEVRADTALPVRQRSEAVAWSGRVAIKRQSPPNRIARLAAEEALTRSLLAEFPAVTEGYESLFGIARDTTPERGQAIARDLLAMNAAPTAIRNGARSLLDRYALLNQPIAPILEKANASLALSAPSQLTVVYAWSSSSPSSLSSAKRVAKQAAGARCIGICLDENLPAAQKAATAHGLPGEQYYHERGAASPLAQALSLGRGPAIYIIDRAGVIRDVQGHTDFTVKIARLEK